jgi:hypothetical protein
MISSMNAVEKTTWEKHDGIGRAFVSMHSSRMWWWWLSAGGLSGKTLGFFRDNPYLDIRLVMTTLSLSCERGLHWVDFTSRWFDDIRGIEEPKVNCSLEVNELHLRHIAYRTCVRKPTLQDDRSVLYIICTETGLDWERSWRLSLPALINSLIIIG